MLSIFLACVILIAVFLFFYLRKNYYRLGNNPFNIKTNKINSSKVRSELEKHLLKLVNYDKATAKRLIEHAKIKYPNKPINWYFEKVIYDLESDRR